MSESSAWKESQIYLTGSEYVEAIIRLCDLSHQSIRIESYIFEEDRSGRRVLIALKSAAARGLKVRVLVDAIGSPSWTVEQVSELARAGVGVRIFGRFPDIIRVAWKLCLSGKLWTAFQALRKFQLRNHRKLAIFDERTALVGSANIGDRFENWRETTVELTGPGVGVLKRTFVRSWRLAARERLRDERAENPAVRTNFTRKERLAVNRDFVKKISAEKHRVYMTTAYFHPRPRLMLALFSALKRGVDLRIISPRDSDISWFPWLSRAAFSGLIQKGARVYEYKSVMNHSKTTLFSRAAIVGSTNMNYRSFMHDLELDVLIDRPEAVKKFETVFKTDLEHSELLTKESIRGFYPYALLVSFLLTPFKRWL
ncbi:MAG: phosphatidylserine/phosphatidylglycerophosphate/cardiolipin synthase family protein [Cryobacterium sp.]|nr:phosphatidylserine/phosphatidylglycerophosphate/cardiolipin synthase family protein [Oligoflexia bacterium]